MPIHVFNTDSIHDEAMEVRVDLAAALRLAAYFDLQEGIDNHFTVTVPGFEDRYLMLPFGKHWSEARCSDMIVFNEAGETLEGEGIVEMTAKCIHAPMHRITGKKVVMHTHQPWVVALNMLEDNRLLPTSQTAALFHSLIAYDDDYTGLATMLREGERLANVMRDKSVLFMRNHGVMVATNNIASAFKILYFLEKVCRTQVLAMSTKKPLSIIEPEVVARLQSPNENDRHQGVRTNLFFSAMKRILDREMPGYEN